MRPSGVLNTDNKVWSSISLTVPLLRADVTPVLAHRQDVLHQETAVVCSIGGAAVGTLQHLRHVFQQLAALQTWPPWTESQTAFEDGLRFSAQLKPTLPTQMAFLW